MVHGKIEDAMQHMYNLVNLAHGAIESGWKVFQVHCSLISSLLVIPARQPRQTTVEP